MTRAGRPTGAAVALALLLGLGACGGDQDDQGPDATGSPTGAPGSDEPAPSSAGGATASAPPDDQRFGNGCQALFSSWRGKPDKLTDEMPAVLALLNLPEVSDSYGLLGNNRLAREEGVTFFLPSNHAISLLSLAFRGELLTDPKFQEQVVSHLVVEGRLEPSELVGEHPTYAGDTLVVEGSGEDLRIDDDGALVECGNIRTLDATIYVIDRMLRP